MVRPGDLSSWDHDNAVLRFASASTVDGDVTPAAKISGPASTLRCAHFGYLDVGHDRMYVADPCPPAGLEIASGSNVPRTATGVMLDLTR